MVPNPEIKRQLIGSMGEIKKEGVVIIHLREKIFEDALMITGVLIEDKNIFSIPYFVK